MRQFRQTVASDKSFCSGERMGLLIPGGYSWTPVWVGHISATAVVACPPNADRCGLRRLLHERRPGRTGVCWRMVSRPPGYGVDTPTDCPEPRPMDGQQVAAALYSRRMPLREPMTCGQS